MPRAVTAFDTGPGFATYKLGKREAFMPLAFTAFLSSTAISPLYDVYVQWVDASNGVIYQQVVGTVSTHSFRLSMAPDAEPFYADQSANHNFPQLENYYLHSIVDMRMPRIPLVNGGSIGLVCVFNGLIPNEGPLGPDITDVQVIGPHLWVQDAGGLRELPANSPPLLTHVSV